MKVKAPSLLKKVIAALSSKTNELRIRMMIFFLLHKNLDTSSLSTSLHALVRKKKNDDVFVEDQLVENRDNCEQDEQGFEEEEEERSKANLLMTKYNKAIRRMEYNTHDHMNNVLENMSRNHHQPNNNNEYDYEAEAQKEKHDYSSEDLTRLLFEESKAEMEMEMESGEVAVADGGSQRMMDSGVEEDIDQAADLFIQRFKKQMLLQKQRSLERQQWLLLSQA